MKKKLNDSKNLVKPHHTSRTDIVSMDETLYLLSSEANKKRLQDAVNEMNQGVYHDSKLIDG
jgi:hypothetical protein